MNPGSAVFEASLSALHYTGLDRLVMPLTGGTGAIFMLHHVLPAIPTVYAPNGHLEVTPEFLDRIIRLVLERGYDIISLDDARARLGEGDLDRPFVCFTIDDGYRDALQHAYPVFKRHGVPFAVYVASDFADGCGNLWWRALECLLRDVDAVEFQFDGVTRRLSCGSPRTKLRTYRAIHYWLGSLPERDARDIVADLCRMYGMDASGLCRQLAMDWNDVRALARDPLVTIGAHTRSHLPLGQLSYAEARAEIEASCARITHEVGGPCHHFSIPEGELGRAGAREFQLIREAGLLTAVTSRRGLLKPQHDEGMAALPRIVLDGDLQKPRYVKVMLTGAPFAMWRGSGGPPARRLSAPAA